MLWSDEDKVEPRETCSGKTVYPHVYDKACGIDRCDLCYFDEPGCWKIRCGDDRGPVYYSTSSEPYEPPKSFLEWLFGLFS